MYKYQRAVTVALIVCLVPMLCGDSVTILQAANVALPTLSRIQMQLFGVGAEVKIKLTSGKKLRGSIAAIQSDSFDLMAARGSSSPRRITYDQVREVKLARLTYQASGPPKPEEVRRVAAGLGVGRHVALKLTSGKKLRGHLQKIKEDRLVLLPDRDPASVEIAYGDVQKLGPNMSTGVKIAIIVGVVVVAVAVIAYFAFREAVEAAEEL